MTICIIPARKGSKRIKNKNIINFFNRPIISYPIEEAIKSKVFTEVYVSTDCSKIKKISRSYGAKVLNLRKKKLSNDGASTKSVIKDFIYKNNFTKKKYFCCIYPTCVLIESSVIKHAYKKFKREKSDMLITLCEFPNSPDRSFIIKNKRYATLLQKKSEHKRSQQLPKKYFDTGSFYFFKTSSFLKSNNLFPLKLSYYMLNQLNSQDINTKEDLQLAKIKFQHKKNV
jgi:pseudaminic acid cytidylyltransferase